MQNNESGEKRMSLGEHLDELRWRIILGLAGPVVLAVVMLFFGKSLIGTICLPLNMVLDRLGIPIQLQSITPFETFAVYLKVSIIGGLILGMPWLIWQVWKFIEGGLYKGERNLVLMLIPSSMILMVAGIMFMYFIMMPACLAYLIKFNLDFPAPAVQKEGFFNWYFDQLGLEKIKIDPDKLNIPKENWPTLAVVKQDPEDLKEGMFWLNLPHNEVRIYVNGKTRSLALKSDSLMAPQMRLSDYISFVTNLALAFAISFQLPLVMVLTASTRLLNYKKMKSVRKYSLLACFVAGALLTPADPISQCLLAVPMYCLYECGLVMVKLLEARRKKGEEEEDLDTPGDLEAGE